MYRKSSQKLCLKYRPGRQYKSGSENFLLTEAGSQIQARAQCVAGALIGFQVRVCKHFFSLSTLDLIMWVGKGPAAIT